MSEELEPLFERLDFIYMPSRDVAADVAYYTDVIGGRLVFAIERFGTRVAMVRIAAAGPDLLLAGHLEGPAPILVHRVVDLDETVARLRERGWDPAPLIEIPHGPCCAFHTPGGHHLAAYQLTRPERVAQLPGRRDF
ncbi:MAG: Glyoxalase-like domain [Conexibacter sp.]|nr:Glyoxalase-like domain [Conexibacter sp.]